MTDTLELFKKELSTELQNNILPFWENKMQDKYHGGFYGRITGEGTLEPNAPKGAIMHGRILWTFSAAYRILGRKKYLDIATRAKDYLLNHFYDMEYGGIYWSLNADGTPLDTRKQFYALGFAIYGLSEYNRATGDAKALEYAIKLFESIEEHSFDLANNGYFEASTRTWDSIEDMRLSEKDANEKKSMNTHLHILEPYANLYRVWNNPRLLKQLVNLINIFLDKIESAGTRHLGLFFDEKWEEKSRGIYSYGHDIEASWLLLEAALETKDKELIERVKMRTRKIADASLEGYRPDGSMIYERHADGSLDEERHWWVQAETVVGLYYLYKEYDDPKGLELAIKTWEYIKEHLIDRVKGEWFWSIFPDGTANRDDDKAGFWKCPYHNGRMCMEIIN